MLLTAFILGLFAMSYLLIPTIPGALALTLVMLGLLWTIEPFGNRFEFRMAMQAWRSWFGID